MKLAEITKIIEGVLFVAGEGVDRDEFKRVYDLSDKEINKCLDALREKYNENSGVNIITYKNKIQLCSNPALADSIAEILNPIRERSLTKSALETIAIIAYKQPITRTEIEQIRGVNCDYAVQLLQKNNLIEVVGRKDAVGKPLLFGTTDDFLKRFELDSLEALPNYKELLDRIRVIHSEGDSLYREFTIPDEENADNLDAENMSGDEPLSGAPNTDGNLEVEAEGAQAENRETAVSMQPDLTKTDEEQKKTKSVKKGKQTKSLKIDEKPTEVLETNTTTETDIEPEQSIVSEAAIEQPETPQESATEQPKLSWKEKLRARLAQREQEENNNI